MEPNRVRIRYATLRDIPLLTQIAVTALNVDDVFDYVYRYRAQYPEDHMFFWQQRLKGELFDAEKAFLVAELQPHEHDQLTKETGSDVAPIPIAFAVWSLQGPCRHGQRKATWPEHLNMMMSRAFNHVESLFIQHMYGQRRDIDWARRQAFVDAGETLDAQYYRRHHNAYHLELLCTKAEHRCLGAGTALVEWAIQRGLRDHAFIGTEPNPQAAAFYRHRGMLPVGRVTVRDPEDVDVSFVVQIVAYAGKEKEEMVEKE